MTRWGYGVLGALVLALVAVLAVPSAHDVRAHWTTAATWRAFASPGALSAAHASLQGNCGACHTGNPALDTARCVGCHATNPALLERQPTRFHATVGSCRACHAEHGGGSARPTAMDHTALARLGAAARAPQGAVATVVDRARDDVASWSRLAPHPPHGAMVTATEATLDCVGCHATQDHHAGMFGRGCASCHGTAAWTISGYAHPSPRSTDCAQCHRPPKTHTMGEHFTMMSQAVAHHPEARVEQCELCHQTTAWNDIRGVGWFECH